MSTYAVSQKLKGKALNSKKKDLRFLMVFLYTTTMVQWSRMLLISGI